MPKPSAKTARVTTAPWHKQPELTHAEKVPDLPMEEYQAIINRQMREQFAQENAPAPAATKRPRSRSVHWDTEVDGDYPPLSRCVSSYDCLLHGMVGFVFELCFTVNTSSLFFVVRQNHFLVVCN